jgi:hypothetical protein
MDFGLCKPSSTILLVSIAGMLYHLFFGPLRSVSWWGAVGLFGTGIFQALCFGGFESIAWVLMMIPILVICFFIAVALFASRMRIEDIEEVPCDECGHRHHRGDPCWKPDQPIHPHGDCPHHDCPYCRGHGCPRCCTST